MSNRIFVSLYFIYKYWVIWVHVIKKKCFYLSFIFEVWNTNLWIWVNFIFFNLSNSLFLSQHLGRTGVACPSLVLHGQEQWAPCCLYASLVVDSVLSADLESLFLFLSFFPRCLDPILGWGGVVGWWGCVVLTWIAPILPRLPIAVSSHWFCVQAPVTLGYTGVWPAPKWWKSYSWCIHTFLSRVASTLIWGDWLSFSG